MTELACGISERRLVVISAGHLYITTRTKVWLIKPDGQTQVVAKGLEQAAGVVLSPDELWLADAESATH